MDISVFKEITLPQFMKRCLSIIHRVDICIG